MSLFTTQIVTTSSSPSLVVQAKVMSNSKPRRGRLLVGPTTNEAGNTVTDGVGQMATSGMNTHVCFAGNSRVAVTNHMLRSDFHVTTPKVIVTI